MSVYDVANLRYYKTVIGYIAQGLREKKSDRQIADVLNSAGLQTLKQQEWNGANVTNALCQLRGKAHGSWALALRQLTRTGDIDFNQVQVIEKSRPQPISFQKKAKPPAPVATVPTTSAAPTKAEVLPENKKYGYLVYMNGSKVVNVDHFDCDKTRRNEYAEACIALVENRDAAKVNGIFFNAVQQFS